VAPRRKPIAWRCEAATTPRTAHHRERPVFGSMLASGRASLDIVMDGTTDRPGRRWSSVTNGGRRRDMRS
jgi:hypothetical protein